MTQFDSQQPPPPENNQQQFGNQAGGPGGPGAPTAGAPKFGFNVSEEAWPEPITSDEKTMGMLAHLLMIFTGFVGPLIIWLIKKDQSRYVDVQGKEALNFSISVSIYTIGLWIVGFILSFIYIGCLFLAMVPLVYIGALILAILGTMKANEGKIYRYPANMRLIK